MHLPALDLMTARLARLLAASALAAALPIAAGAQQDAPARATRSAAAMEDAAAAWDRGDYPAALRGFRALLGDGAAPAVVERIALITGELHPSDSLAADGRAPIFAAGADLAAFESGAGAGRAVHVVRVGESPAVIATVAGHGAALAPDGSRLAVLRVVENDSLRMARADVARLQAAGADRAALLARLRLVGELEARLARLVVRDVGSGRETEIVAPELLKASLAFSPDGATLYFLARAPHAAGVELHAVPAAGGRAEALTSDGEAKSALAVAAGSGRLVFAVGQGDPFAGAFQRPSTGGAIAVLDPATRQARTFPGSGASLSRDGSAMAYLTRVGAVTELRVARLAGGEPATVVRAAGPIAAAAISPDGARVAYQRMVREDWEIFVAAADGSGERRLTREIQDDLLPQWLDGRRLLVKQGEGRHRRSSVLDVETGARRRLLHNNTVRTIAPEYEWAVSGGGSEVLIVAERDGDTVSPERSVHLVDLARAVGVPELRARVERQLAAEMELRERGRRLFAPIADAVRRAVADVSKERIYGYQRDLFEFDSKHVSQPGNRKAIAYLAERFRAFGYEPELQEFTPRGHPPTANVLATLKGTTHPELVYIVSSHFDSRPDGPGAEDNTSGTAALLEAARVLAGRPQPATIVFAAFTGEESGALGSREWVRRAVADSVRLLGALNNDMIGWTNDARLDNTIRYSNPGIRDLQHAAAIHFTRLITYDAVYYKGTDAAAYHERYGDIVGGIGSYPVLASPHYHEPHDVLETINHELVTETARTTVASLMALASSPARLRGLVARRVPGGRGVEVAWTRSPERGVSGYRVAFGPPSDPMRRTITVRAPRARLAGVEPGWAVAVRAVAASGMQGWDWARTTIPEQ